MMRLGYLDCEMMALGTKLYVARKKIGNVVRHNCVAAAMHEAKATVTEKVKSVDMKNLKSKFKFKKKNKEESAAEEIKAEETDFREVSDEEISRMTTEDAPGMNIWVTSEEPVIENGPDFSTLRGVTYDDDPSVSNFVVTGTLDDEEVNQNDEQIPRPVTEEDLKIALEKMRANQVPISNDDGRIGYPSN